MLDTRISQALLKLTDCSKEPSLNLDHVSKISTILDQYFGDFGRSREFRGVEELLAPRIAEILQLLGPEQGLAFATKYFLFCYTLTQNYKQVQLAIYKDLALPFKTWAEVRWAFLKSAVQRVTPGDEYVFVCRHAVTVGGYAPGSSVYTFAKALLEGGKPVTVISLGGKSPEFEQLADKYVNFTLHQLEPISLLIRMISLIEILKILKPKVVLTEIEFDIVSIFSILNPNVPTIFLSPGYYNLPWFDKIGLTDNLSVSPVGDREEDFFEIPTYVASEILNPVVDQRSIEKTKSQLSLTQNDFVIGSFARMEKFQTPFLAVLKCVLSRIPNSKVILAGPNDRNPVANELAHFIERKRAFVLPSSDVHVLGHCVDIGLDTFPTHSGFSVLELMAKGVPVVAKMDEEMDSLWRQRLPELMRESDNELCDLICEICTKKQYLEKLSAKTKNFMNNNENDSIFLGALDQAIHSVKSSAGLHLIN
ncbi:MAG: hypothetical protein VW124_12370 [Paracoccaceae bacterium]